MSSGEPSNRSGWRGIVADIERAMTPRGRSGVGCHVVEGTRLHERALRAGAGIEAAVTTAGYRDDPSERVQDLLRDLESSGCRIETAPDAVVARLTEGRAIGAVVGLARIPEPVTLAAARAAAPARPAVFLVGIDVGDPGNVGALVRTALASGAAAYVATGFGDPYHPRAVRTSMGAVFRLPVIRFLTFAGALRELDALGTYKVAAVSGGGVQLPDASLGADPIALCMGSEAFGLPEDVLAAMDTQVTIPMHTDIDSYSINAAAAIMLYEIGRRDRSDPPPTW